MSDLDEKLREITIDIVLQDVGTDFVRGDKHIYSVGLDDNALAQIKKCFAEEYRLIKEGDWVNEKGKTVNLMTGQEYYDKFEKELDSEFASDRVDMGGEIGQDQVLEVAKRAAGLI